jgi:DNA polymerase alpha-associated DNA helicase A
MERRSLPALHPMSLSTVRNFLFRAPGSANVDPIADMVEKLAASGSKVKIVRLGHPARVLPGAMSHTIDDVYRDSNAFEVVKAIVEDMDKLQKDINRSRTFGEKKGKRAEWNGMRKDLKTREISGLQQIIKDADVVLCTCTGAQDRNLKKFNELFGSLYQPRPVVSTSDDLFL